MYLYCTFTSQHGVEKNRRQNGCNSAPGSVSLIKWIAIKVCSHMMPSTTGKTKLLLAARAGLWRNALESFLKAMPELDVYSEVNDLGEMDIYLCKQAPEILILEATLCGERLIQTLKRLSESFPDLNVIVIVDNVGQFEVVNAAGIGRVMMKSMLHNQLDAAYFRKKLAM